MRLFLLVCIFSCCASEINYTEEIKSIAQEILATNRIEDIESVAQEIQCHFYNMNIINQSMPHNIYRDPTTCQTEKSFFGSDMSISAVFMNKRVALSSTLRNIKSQIKRYQHQKETLLAITIDLKKTKEASYVLLTQTKLLKTAMELVMKKYKEQKIQRNLILRRSTSTTSEESL